MPNSVQVIELRVPIDRVRSLSEGQRYTYYLLGFIFNELMCLRKLISFSLQQRGADMRPVRLNAETSQILLLFRIACAKLWEAQLKLNSKEVSGVLRKDVWPHWPAGAAALKAVNKAVSDAEWLPRVRNGLGFHYPSVTDWRAYIAPTDDWVDDIIYAGPETGNHFYDAAESVAKHHMFGFDAPMQPEQVKRTIEEMISLLGKMSDVVEESLGTFIANHLLAQDPLGGPVHAISAPKYTEQRIPFWTEMSGAKKRAARRSGGAA